MPMIPTAPVLPVDPALTADLRQAAATIARRLQELNNGNLPCGECRRNHWVNPLHHNARETLTETVGRIRRWADALDDPEAYTVNAVLKTDAGSGGETTERARRARARTYEPRKETR